MKILRRMSKAFASRCGMQGVQEGRMMPCILAEQGESTDAAEGFGCCSTIPYIKSSSLSGIRSLNHQW